jgi:hypothetical protein
VQNEHKPRNHESSRKHTITTGGQQTQAREVRPGPLRSSLRELQALLRSRACHLSEAAVHLTAAVDHRQQATGVAYSLHDRSQSHPIRPDFRRSRRSHLVVGIQDRCIRPD